MILTVAGIGPGDPGLVTVGALEAISEADIVLSPRSKEGRESVAEKIIRAHLPKIKTVPLIFPMTNDGEKRDRILREQIAELSGRLDGARSVVLPVIGDSTLYATGSYLFGVWRKLAPDIELKLIPGISAHSLSAARTGSFLAMGEEALAVISCTAGGELVRKVLFEAEVAALYKPSALKDELRSVISSAGPWRKIVRVDRAGLPDEKITEGSSALADSDEYLSIILLWR